MCWFIPLSGLLHALGEFIPLRLRFNCTLDKGRNRFTGPLRGLLRCFQCRRG